VNYRVGIGFDLHRLGPGKSLTIGGVSIPHDKSLIGHSDADVLLHAITDALLGACGAGNIGELFPDSDPQFKGTASVHFLRGTADLIRERGYEIGNVDANVLAEKPKLLGYFSQMRSVIAGALSISVDQVSIKAKTMERVGAIGNEDAIAAEAVALLFSGRVERM
jgi:2-C-methyl-D-erythritol 2,4-cyclodiphosphate synthase